MSCNVFLFVLLQGHFGVFAKTLITLLKMQIMSRMLQSIYYVGNKRAVRASSLFPILSVGLLFLGGVCVAASEFYKSRYNVILSAGILFVSAGLSNIIGIIVYISANSGDPSQSDNKKSYSYGWSFYFGALSFVLAEMVGVLAVHVFIEKHRQLRTKGRPSLMKPPISRSSSYYRNRYYQNRGRRYSYRSNHSTGDSFRASLVRDREPSISAESKVNAMLLTTTQRCCLETVLPTEGPRLSERRGNRGGRCTGVKHKRNFRENRRLNERKSSHFLGKERRKNLETGNGLH
ncbi:uncharacterized protein cacng3a isoform X2 [Siniperca chuatsi]|uniref:uncharacterized protein cacng3a isoform X2 n=1 Tax=Siniperca chuatsi TaxID=119488 RepID=UPI001CE0E100|nr:uncharacterized protein cacng3a isoform X2 [Siniperca chuatsi]